MTKTTVLVALVGCGSEEGSDSSPEWSVVEAPLLSIGEVAGDAPYLFESIRSAGFLPDGRIVVADQGHSAIRVFAADGDFLVEMGGPGEGPGEIGTLTGLWIRPPDTIGVYDGANARLSIYGAAGAFHFSRNLVFPPEVSRAPDFFVGAFSNGDLALGLTEASPRDPTRSSPDREIVGRYAPDGRHLGHVVDIPGFRRYGSGPVPFSPFPYGAAFGDSIVFSDGLQPRVTFRSGTDGGERTVATPSSPFASRSASGAAWSVLEDELIRTGNEFYLERLESTLRTDPIPHLGGMLVDDELQIWVKEFDPRSDAIWLGGGSRMWGGRWWVLDRTGRVQARLRLPESFHPLAIQGDRLLGLAKDEFDVERVAIHRILR